MELSTKVLLLLAIVVLLTELLPKSSMTKEERREKVRQKIEKRKQALGEPEVEEEEAFLVDADEDPVDDTAEEGCSLMEAKQLIVDGTQLMEDNGVQLPDEIVKELRSRFLNKGRIMEYATQRDAEIKKLVSEKKSQEKN